jgi:hypothetical protein
MKRKTHLIIIFKLVDLLIYKIHQNQILVLTNKAFISRTNDCFKPTFLIPRFCTQRPV